MHLPLVKTYQQNPLVFLHGKHICQHTFTNKAYSLHVYKYILKSLYVQMVKEILQSASKKEQAAFQMENVVQCYQEGEGEELKFFTVNYPYWPGIVHSYKSKLVCIAALSCLIFQLMSQEY